MQIIQKWKLVYTEKFKPAKLNPKDSDDVGQENYIFKYLIQSEIE